MFGQPPPDGGADGGGGGGGDGGAARKGRSSRRETWCPGRSGWELPLQGERSLATYGSYSCQAEGGKFCVPATLLDPAWRVDPAAVVPMPCPPLSTAEGGAGRKRPAPSLNAGGMGPLLEDGDDQDCGAGDLRRSQPRLRFSGQSGERCAPPRGHACTLVAGPAAPAGCFEASRCPLIVCVGTTPATTADLPSAPQTCPQTAATLRPSATASPPPAAP
jgi:hypothetical protein